MSDKDIEPVKLNQEELRQKINLETGRISWDELQRHFARGAIVIVATELDLVDVAAAMAQDRLTQVKQWTEAGLIRRALDDDARLWASQTTQFWSCVVAPWVLVQEITTH